MRGMSRGLSILVLAAAAATGVAHAAKVEHTKIVPPKSALPAPDGLKAIGEPTRFLQHGDRLYVAGKEGIAALSADGQVIWTTPLDFAGIREIEVDDAGIAYSGFTVTGEKAGAFTWWGNDIHKLAFAPSVVGMLTLDGARTWQAAGPASRISAPCLTPDKVGILTGEKFHIYARGDGKLTVAESDLEPAALPNEYASRMFRPRPLFMNNEFVGAYFYNYYRIAPDGKELFRDHKSQTNIVAGPFNYNGNMLIGSYSVDMQQNPNKSLITVVEPTGDVKKVWREDIADDHSATGDIVLDGDTIYASSNFTVTALTSKGKKIWDQESKDGGLSAGSMRGVRFEKFFGYRSFGGQGMVMNGDHLYLATKRKYTGPDPTGKKKKDIELWTDVITVLNKTTGSYVETIDVKQNIIDMNVWNGRLAVATPAGVHFLSLD